MNEEKHEETEMVRLGKLGSKSMPEEDRDKDMVTCAGCGKLFNKLAYPDAPCMRADIMKKGDGLQWFCFHDEYCIVTLLSLYIISLNVFCLPHLSETMYKFFIFVFDSAIECVYIHYK